MHSPARLVATSLLIGLPLLVIAATPAELQQQAKDLQNKVNQLQLQSGNVPGGGALVCPPLRGEMKRGSSGIDVQNLQKFLAQDPGIYPEAQVSGFYGALTEAAVKRMQVKFNIVSSGDYNTIGFGAVGARTLASIAAQCSGSLSVASSAAPSVGGFMSVSPIAGTAPLTISVQAIVNTANVCGGAVYNIDYGDGSIQSQIPVGATNCQQVGKLLSHTYLSPGNYFVSLSSGQHRTTASVAVYGGGTFVQAPQQVQQVQQAQPTTVAITQYRDSISATPNSGNAPLSVVFTGVINAQQSCNGGTYMLVFGDGNTAGLSFDGSTCAARTFNVGHVYSTAGTSTAELRFGSTAGPLIGTLTITAN